ncbi:MAG: hypothetical protein LW816_02330 [Planctomyces sp.]|nr:hypothetical protein [Planctomyces sp.]
MKAKSFGGRPVTAVVRQEILKQMPSNDSSLSRRCVVVALRLCLVFFLNMWLIAQFMLLDGQIALPIGTFTVCGDPGGAYFGYLPPQPLIGCTPELRLIDYSSTQALVNVRDSLERKHRSILQLPGLRVWRSILSLAHFDRIVVYVGYYVLLFTILMADVAIHRRTFKVLVQRLAARVATSGEQCDARRVAVVRS